MARDDLDKIELDKRGSNSLEKSSINSLDQLRNINAQEAVQRAQRESDSNSSRSVTYRRRVKTEQTWKEESRRREVRVKELALEGVQYVDGDGYGDGQERNC